MKGKAASAIQIGFCTDPGRAREHNEDALGLPPRRPAGVLRRQGRLWVVADGMGGHRAGDVASQLAVETVQTVFYQAANNQPRQALAQVLETAVQAANQAVYQRAQLPEWQGMGTTLVAALIYQNRLMIAHVGDSRAYLLRHRRFQRLTEDDTWVAGQVKAGVLTPQEAAQHEQKGVLTRALGRRPAVDVSIGAYPWQPGDTFLLCTDGLTNCLSDQEIAAILAQAPPQQAAEQLVARSNQRGGPDNITALVGYRPKSGARRFWLTNLLDRSERAWPGLALMALGLGLLAVVILAAVVRFFFTNDLPYEPPQPVITSPPVPGLLFSGRLERVARQGEVWQLTARNTGGQYLVYCRPGGGKTFPESAPLLYNLVVVYGRRPAADPQHVEADFIEAEAFPYNGVNWYLWCDQFSPTGQEVLVQTSLSNQNAFYIRFNQAPETVLPQIPFSPPFFIRGQWQKADNTYLFLTNPEKILDENGQPY
ncbi:MAG: Stp1/IreP family PP2C-type Ser/Thr phosphatase [Anaerolineae bacterium]|nr:Stp1/IreP family PP2C-type Ser/Thr phosphatase [Anaerolineae bacterium]